MHIDGSEINRKARKRARREALNHNCRKMTTVVIEGKKSNSCRRVKHKKDWIAEYTENHC